MKMPSCSILFMILMLLFPSEMDEAFDKIHLVKAL